MLLVIETAYGEAYRHHKGQLTCSLAGFDEHSLGMVLVRRGVLMAMEDIPFILGEY